MLSQCTNPQCSKPFLKLREGKLFLVEKEFSFKSAESSTSTSVPARKPPRRFEHFWLCSDCAAQWTLIHDREHGIGLAPLRRPVPGVPPPMKPAWGGIA
jgi:hypothetical protein